MKKVLIGCGVVSLLFIVIVGGFLFWSVSKLQQVGKEVEAAAAEMKAIQAKYPYTAPATAALDPERTAAYFAARKGILDAIAQDPKLKDLVAVLNTPSGQNANVNPLGIMMGAVTSISSMIKAASAEFDKAQMGPDEYLYHTKVIYLTLAAAEARSAKDPAVQSLISDVQGTIARINEHKQMPTGKELRAIGMQMRSIPGIDENLDRNLKLIAPHADTYKRGEAVLMDMILATGQFQNGQFQMNQSAMELLGDTSGNAAATDSADDEAGAETDPSSEPAPAGN
jgi:hypothetical protein